MQIELSDEAEFLQFFKEYSLTDGPLRADTLIIKKDPERRIQKNIGQIFRWFNVVEYKNPWESLAVRTYYQAVSYAAVFQSHTDRENAVLPEEITLTLVGNHYPRKLFRFLEDFYNARIEQSFSGIYYVEGAVFPTQVIVQKELPTEENVWLSRLRQDLKMEIDVAALAQAYAGALVSLSGLGAAICDVEQVIAVAGPAKKEPLHKPLSPQLDELVQGKRPFTTPGQDTVPVAQGVAAEALAVFPLVAEGDPMGAVLLLKGERSPKQLDAGTLESLRAAAMFLSRQLEV